MVCSLYPPYYRMPMGAAMLQLATPWHSSIFNGFSCYLDSATLSLPSVVISGASDPPQPHVLDTTVQTWNVRRRLRNSAEYVQKKWPVWQQQLDQFATT